MKTNILAQIAELNRMGMPQLKERWTALFNTDPPAQNRAHMVKCLAYRIQELAYDGLSEETQAQLREIAEGYEQASKRNNKNGPVTGTRLLREWNGERHEVTVTRGGYEYRGRPYKSLSAVARTITGTRWNGPAFFGLRKQEKAA
ncbi:MAG: DUF2924 domain-containing protein [Thermoguttaceae bacterium]